RFLDWQAGQLDGSPTADEMTARVVSHAVTGSLSRPAGRLILAFIILALAAVAIGVAVIGSRQARKVLVTPPTATPTPAASSPFFPIAYHHKCAITLANGTGIVRTD